ncbi:DNA recombination protein RmuC [Patescibacteria group bacterium]|nr:DNA recombination protein RmuC [Patescibacteria group bacterium]MCL5010287.1 DNA recombination protein RmuC [Patescibacteria group bacterium]
MQEVITVSIILVLGLGLIVFLLERRINELKDNKIDASLLEWLKSMNASIESTNKSLNETLRVNSLDVTRILMANSRELNLRLDKAASVIKEVSREVGQMSEIGRNMRELQDFLKSPKLRGNIGEQVLKDLISQMFPKNSFFLQYTFKSGERVDAAIKTDAGILPIDSKFPMDNFQKMAEGESESIRLEARKEFVRNVKKHIDAISKKYILPDEGTMDFALMYVPSETIYYELVNITEVMEHARRSRVYLVSPSTLYAHLQTILLSFEGKEIEAKSKQIFKMLRTMQVDYEKVQAGMETLGRHLNNASSQFRSVSAGFSRIGDNLNTSQMVEEKTSA